MIVASLVWAFTWLLWHKTDLKLIKHQGLHCHILCILVSATRVSQERGQIREKPRCRVHRVLLTKNRLWAPFVARNNNDCVVLILLDLLSAFIPFITICLCRDCIIVLVLRRKYWTRKSRKSNSICQDRWQCLCDAPFRLWSSSGLSFMSVIVLIIYCAAGWYPMQVWLVFPSLCRRHKGVHLPTFTYPIVMSLLLSSTVWIAACQTLVTGWPFIVFSSYYVSLALQHYSFVTHKWLAGKGPLSILLQIKGAVSRQASSFCLILQITRPQSLWNIK